MANPTYILITSTELSSTANSVTFSAIPQTYTDLEVRISARQFQSNSGSPIYVQVNGDTSSSSYANVYWDFQSNPTTTARGASNYVSQITDGSATTNGYSYFKIYYPNYTDSTKYKPFAYTCYYGRASGGGFTYANDGVVMRNNTDAITSITIPAYNSGTQYFATNSLFELYGIKNS